MTPANRQEIVALHKDYTKIGEAVCIEKISAAVASAPTTATRNRIRSQFRPNKKASAFELFAIVCMGRLLVSFRIETRDEFGQKMDS